MEDAPSPDDTLPDDAYADTLVDVDALAGFTLPEFPTPRAVAVRLGRRSADEEE